jgi:predicted ATPase/DNA-binding CsgD family transcriptional regulator
MTVDAELFGDALPTYLTRFIGRRSECDELVELLAEPGVVTVCGVGGAGKTRLSVEVARRVGAGGDLRVSWVPLTTALDSDGVVPAVARGLGLNGVAELHQLRAAVGSGRVLLVLDNCEHVVSGCRALLGELVSDGGDLRVLATSRVPLDIADERIYGVPPLGETSAHGEDATDAVALFVDRAAGVAAGYALTELNRPIVAEICATLRGSPLAIELAASWIRVLSPRDLLAYLAQAHATVASDSATFLEERHRSIQAVLDSSWQWLGSSDRPVVEALGVFVGGFTREAAEAVAGADLGTLSRLSQLALIQRVPDPFGGSRYAMHELVRTYALDRLQGSEGPRGRHFRYFLSHFDTARAAPNVPLEPAWSDPLVVDLANVDAALSYALNQGDAESAQRLAVGLDHYWLFCIHSAQHRAARLEAALTLPQSSKADGSARARAQALLTLGRLQCATDSARSRSRFNEARRLFEQVGDAAGVASCLLERGNLHLVEGDYHGCRRDCLEGLARFRACGDEHGAAWCLETIGEAAILAGDLSEATARLSEAATYFAARSSAFGVCYSGIDLALAHQLRGEWAESVDACSRALECQRRHRVHAASGDVLEVVARQCAELARWTDAAHLYGAAANWHSQHDKVFWYSLYSRFSLADVVRGQLGEPAWIEAHQAGRRLPPDRAIEIAGEQLSDLRSQLEIGSAGLSLRETEVLRLVAAGCTDLNIAQQLVLSTRTIHAHLRSIYRKLGVSSRTSAVVAAGLVTPPRRH